MRFAPSSSGHRLPATSSWRWFIITAGLVGFVVGFLAARSWF